MKNPRYQDLEIRTSYGQVKKVQSLTLDLLRFFKRKLEIFKGKLEMHSLCDKIAGEKRQIYTA